ncbi:MAG: 50S ribosomal protein L21 [Candidatus Binatia bacterium]
MYAVVRSGGKQYRVSPGEVFRVEKLDGEVGDKVALADVLLIGGDGDIRIGTPLLAEATVTAEIVAQGKAKKIVVFKKKRRKSYSRKRGHRQDITSLKVIEINS